ncbi:MAG: thiamine diphosphokinase, partial [Pseudomonadota bacterium]
YRRIFLGQNCGTFSVTETKPVVRDDHPVVLIGPADVEKDDLERVLQPGRKVVAADGGAARALEFGVTPDAVIGDFDSFAPDTRIGASKLHRIADQDSTDFEKCLARISAPRVLAFGFLGARIDHGLAVLSALAKTPPGWCVLVSPHDIAVHCPRDIDLDLAPGTRVSLFPMTPVTGRSTGLHWPIEGLAFDPMGQIGTSNHATGPVTLEMAGQGMLLILPPAAFRPLLAALPSA